MTTIHDIERTLAQFIDTVHRWDEGIASNVLRDENAGDTVGGGEGPNRDLDLDLVNDMFGRLAAGAQDLQRIRARLAARRNARANINMLPEDVLRLIFASYVRNVVVLSNSSVFGEPFHPPSIALRIHPAFILSWACSNWRRIALNDPQIWSHIALGWHSSAMVQTLFERAKDHFLFIHCHGHTHEDIGRVSQLALQFLPSRLSHVRELSLNIPMGQQITATMLGSPAPALERFEFFPISTSSSNAIIETPLFSGSADHLRHLTLGGLRMPWRRGYYRNLSTLTIRGFLFHTRSAQDHDICCVLRDSPLLEGLEIAGRIHERDVFNDPNHSIPTTSTSHRACSRVQLPNLRSLILDLPASMVYHLLSCMQADYISTLRILIKYMVDETVAGLVASLFDPDILPSAALSGMKSLDIHHAVVQQNPPSDRTRISAHEGPRDMAFATPQREFRVEWSDITSPAIYSETLRQIASRLLALSTTDNIEELSLYSKVEAEEHPATILARLPSLKGMMVDGTLVPEVIEQLCSEDAATAARRWRQMNTLLVRYCTLMSGDLDALLAWCADHRESMRKLEFHGVDFEVASPNAMEAYVRGFGGIYQLEVCWGWGVCDVRCSDDGRAYRLRFEDQRYTMVDSDGDVVSDFYLASTCNDLA